MTLKGTSLCLDEESIAAFIMGELAGADLAKVDVHLANCGTCGEVVAAAAHGAWIASGERAAPAVESTSALVQQLMPGEPPSPALVPGDVVSNKYCIEAHVGRGGMGEVFSALHVHLGHRVALKVLRSLDAGMSARFLREAQIGARVRNEHIVQVFDIGHLSSGAPYLVMEYLVGEDLARTIARGPLEPARAVGYLLQAGTALQAAHDAGVVHRDLKPANLFLVARQAGLPLLKVLDFGISKYLGSAATDGIETVPGTFIGSPLYMSPEQLTAPDEIDARSDIWSLGVILYEAVTGRPPFHAAELLTLSIAIARDAPVPPSVLCPALPPGMEAAILRCLEKERGARFQSVRDLMSCLAPFAAPAGDVPACVDVAASPAVGATHRPSVEPARGSSSRALSLPGSEAQPAVQGRAQAADRIRAWQVLAEDQDALFAVWRDVFVVIWKKETTLAAVRRFDHEAMTFGRSHPRGIAALIVVEEEAGFPSSETRTAIASLLRRMGPFTRCAALVFEGGGFRASAVRSVVTGLSLAARPSFPYRVCSLDAAARSFAEALREHPGPPFRASEFLAGLAELRASARARTGLGWS